MIGIYSVCQAKSWTSYTNLGATPSDSDTLLINDVSDTEDDATGTVKSLAWLYVQSRDSDLTAVAALTTAAYGLALLEVATELAFQQLVNLEIGVDVQAYHANLEAIADAATGVSDPTIMMYDSDDEAGTAKIKGTSVGGMSNDIVMSLWVDVDGTPTEFFQVDGVNENVTVNVPFHGGPLYRLNYASGAIDGGDAGVCYVRSVSSGVRDYDLPAEPECGGAGSGASKIFCFTQRGTSVLTIDPAAGDRINLISGDLTAGNAIDSSGTAGDMICLVGMDNAGTNTWYQFEYVGTWADGGAD